MHGFRQESSDISENFFDEKTSCVGTGLGELVSFHFLMDAEQVLASNFSGPGLWRATFARVRGYWFIMTRTDMFLCENIKPSGDGFACQVKRSWK